MTGRVTELGNVNRFTDWGASARQRLAKAEQQIASGRRYERPSEAPVQAGEILASRHRLARLEQFVRNQTNANEWLQTADSSLQSGVAALTRARTLALQAVNASTSGEGRDAIAAEIRSVAREVLALANTTIDGRPLFGGTTDSSAAYDDSGAYLGDTGGVRRRIDDDLTIDVGANGPAVFGTSNAADPYNGSVFEALEELAVRIEAGDVDGGRDGIEAIDAAMSRLQTELGRIGGVGSRLEAVAEAAADEQVRMIGRLSDREDTDIAAAVISLRSAEASYEATLAASARALNRSLLDFLR